MSLLVAFLIFLATYIIIQLWNSIKRPTNFPPGPKFMPWVGNAFQLKRESLLSGGQHKAYEKWSKCYNTDVLGLKLGRDLVVVALSYSAVREILLSTDFDGRPDTFFFRLRSMGKRKGITGTDGDLWNEQRQFGLKQLHNVGFGRTFMEKHIEKEVAILLKKIENVKGQTVPPSHLLAHAVVNVLWTMVAGKRFETNDESLFQLLDLLNERSRAFDMAGGLLSQFPWLRFIAPTASGYKLICQLNVKLKEIFAQTIEEHKQTLDAGKADNDFIYIYLTKMQEQQTIANSTFSEAQLVMVILDFFIAGSQTTSLTIELGLMTLALRPDIQQQLYEEVIKNMKSPDDLNFPHLQMKTFYPLTEAFIMEVHRYFHILPIVGPRRTLKDTTLRGYNIPKNTIAFIGLRSVLMDDSHWIDPNVFRFTRFIDDEGKVIKDNYFMPFGQGRRRCLGDALARACIFSFLVKIVQHFNIELSDNPAERPCTQLLPGIILTPKPYKIRFVKRA